MKEIVDGFINREGDIFEFGNSQEGGSCTQSQVLQMIADSEVKAHRHEISEINGLQSALEGIASESGSGDGLTRSEIEELIGTTLPAQHTHSSITSALADILLSEENSDGNIVLQITDKNGDEYNTTITPSNISNLGLALKTPSSTPENNANKLITSKAVYDAIENLKPVMCIEIRKTVGLEADDILAIRSVSDDTTHDGHTAYCFKYGDVKYYTYSKNPKENDAVYNFYDGIDTGNTPRYIWIQYGVIYAIERGSIGSDYVTPVDITGLNAKLVDLTNRILLLESTSATSFPDDVWETIENISFDGTQTGGTLYFSGTSNDHTHIPKSGDVIRIKGASQNYVYYGAVIRVEQAPYRIITNIDLSEIPNSGGFLLALKSNLD